MEFDCIIGNRVIFYVERSFKNGIYTMEEIAVINIPIHLQEIPAFFSEINKLIQVIT
jgi:hypothetical protein